MGAAAMVTFYFHRRKWSKHSGFPCTTVKNRTIPVPQSRKWGWSLNLARLTSFGKENNRYHFVDKFDEHFICHGSVDRKRTQSLCVESQVRLRVFSMLPAGAMHNFTDWTNRFIDAAGRAYFPVCALHVCLLTLSLHTWKVSLRSVL